MTVDQVTAEADTIAFRSTMRGTHQHEYLGIPATGRQVAVSLVDMIRLEGGHFAEQWGGPNLLDLAQQIGAKLVAEASES